MLRQRKQFSDNALYLLKNRYLLKDPKTLDVIEDEKDFFPRIANGIANVELNYGKSQEYVDNFRNDMLEAMDNHRICPAGRTLSNVSADTPVVPNCVVLHIEDSLDHICKTLHDASLLQQAGSGLGFPVHLMRPAGEVVKKSKTTSSGPISFLRQYASWFSNIKQNNRSGANLASCYVKHPDVLDFIRCKENMKDNSMECFNISVLVTDDFMDAATNPENPNYEKPWVCEFNGKEYKPRIIHRDENQRLVTKIEETNHTARDIFKEIIYRAWSDGCPGVLFYDTINRTNPLPLIGPIQCCNPCGEISMHDGDVCLLIALNLGEYVENTQDGPKINFNLLEKDLRIAVNMGDCTVDLYNVPVERVANQIKNNRRLGIGPMGVYDMCVKMRVRYGSDDSLQIIRQVMQLWKDVLIDESRKIAQEKGPFLNWENSIFFLNNEPFRRNVALSDAAPTGSISRLFECSSGVEPAFSLAYTSKVMNTTVKHFNPLLEQELINLGLDKNEELMNKIAKTGSVQNIDEIPQWMKEVFVCAQEISPEDHVRVQATFQEYLENAISKTVNYNHNASLEDVEKGYIMAWKMKCKGFTIFRDQCRSKQVLNHGIDVDEKKDKTERITIGESILPNIDQNKLILAIEENLKHTLDFKIDDDLITQMASNITSSYLGQCAKPSCSSSQSSSDNEESITIDILSTTPSPSKRSPFYCLECRGTDIIMAEGCKRCMSCNWSPCNG